MPTPRLWALPVVLVQLSWQTTSAWLLLCALPLLACNLRVLCARLHRRSGRALAAAMTATVGLACQKVSGSSHLCVQAAVDSTLLLCSFCGLWPPASCMRHSLLQRAPACNFASSPQTARTLGKQTAGWCQHQQADAVVERLLHLQSCLTLFLLPIPLMATKTWLHVPPLSLP